MIKRLNSIIRKPFRSTSDKGQVAVVLILITAVALVFYAISLNFSRISQSKTLVTIASDTGAAQLASGMAGYGQMLSKTQLDGQQRKCDSTSLLVAIILFIVVVIVSIISWGQATYVVCILAMALMFAAVVLNAVVLQPGITSLWNRVKQKTMSTRDQLVENAIEGGLQKVVTDQKNVPDVGDMDGDRIWEPISTADSNILTPADAISRYASYYNERMKAIQSGSIVEIQNFLDALAEFLYEGTDGWGIYDNSSFTCSSAECNPCCVPYEGSIYGTSFIGGRLKTCPDQSNDVLWQSKCAAISPYNDGTLPLSPPGVYPWAYQKYFENPSIAQRPCANVSPCPSGCTSCSSGSTDTYPPFFSFRELIGRDDEHQLFVKNPVDPNGVQTQTGSWPPPLPPAPWNFLLQDTTQYYVNPPFVPTRDNRKGIFPFFYKAADWGVDISPSKLDRATHPEHCYWFDNNYDACPVSLGSLPLEIQNQPLNLPNDPATLTYNTTAYVDGFVAATGGTPPLAVDKVGFPDNIVEDDKDALGNPAPQCAQKALATGGGFWKRGADRYCSDDPNDWPYFIQCPKHGAGCVDYDGADSYARDCLCGENMSARPENFPDDVLDDIVYGLPDFIDWAIATLKQPVVDLKADFSNWYGSAADWIEPGTSGGAWGSGALSGTDCFECNLEDGGLITWFKEISMMINSLEAWRNNTSYASSAGACDEVWCVPDRTCPGGGNWGSSARVGSLGYLEAETFNDRDGDGVRGDVDDVIYCLEWNVNDTVITNDGLQSATGNAHKFQACWSACDDVARNISIPLRAYHANTFCQSLPRSLVPGFDGRFAPLDIANLSCGTTCSDCIAICAGNATCIAGCRCGSCACSDAACLSAQTAAAKGSCTDAAYMADLWQSTIEARNQVAKFNQRKIFLSNRVREVNDILNNVLVPAWQKFNGFLNGSAVQNLIQYRINFSNLTKDEGLPYQAVYGWQDDPPKDDLSKPGNWHVVKVDARIPDKCDNFCGAGGGNDPGWPRVKTKTEAWGTRRCYELVNTSGMVKFRTTRFDQKSTTSSLLFPNGTPIWKFRQDHPLRLRDISSALNNMPAQCSVGTVKTFPDGTPQDSDNTPTTIYRGAFMLNQKLDGTKIDPACKTACLSDISCEARCPRPDNRACWDTVHKVLGNGISSETCAQYYWHEGTNQGMGFKFVDCVNF